MVKRRALIPGTVLEKRYIRLQGKATTVALERPYWRLIEILAERTEQDWQQVVRTFLRQQPQTFKSKAAFLRLATVKLIVKLFDQELHDQMFRLK